MKLCGNGCPGAYLQSFSWKKVTLLWYSATSAERRTDQICTREPFSHWLVIWLTQAQTCQKRMRLEIHRKYSCPRHFRCTSCIIEDLNVCANTTEKKKPQSCHIHFPVLRCFSLIFQNRWESPWKIFFLKFSDMMLAYLRFKQNTKHQKLLFKYEVLIVSQEFK